MSTRTAKDDSVLRQERYASSPEFERGLLAGRVAERCALLDTAADRELIWFIQYLSHQPGGLAAVAAELIERFADRLGTATMVKSGNRKSQHCCADEVRAIRKELPRGLGMRFPLRGETRDELSQICGSKIDRDHYSGQRARRLMVMADESLSRVGMVNDGRLAELDAAEAKDREAAKQNPISYSVAAFFDLCREAAVNGFDVENGTVNLEKELYRLCLDPAWNLTTDAPWYFSVLIDALREYQAEFIKSKAASGFTTALGQKVCAGLDYTAYGRCLTLMQGEARLGKTHAARAWCEQHPGKARFIEVPPGNDETSFFRAIARGIGLGSFLNYKTTELLARVESVLLTGNILLVLDEAQRLWPQRNLRYGFPSRIVRVMAWANNGVPIAMISTPQFIETQKAVEKSGWNSAQLTGRLYDYVPLPADLSSDDLMGVAESVLPEADAQCLRALAVYARSSARYLAAIDSISKRARYIALRSGRATATTEDVRKAMQESVIPSDTKLHRALDAASKSRMRRIEPAPATQADVEPPLRGSRPVMPDFVRRGEALPELVES